MRQSLLLVSHRPADLVLGLLAVEIVAPGRDQAVLVDLDDRGAVHLDARPSPRLAVVGGSADPLEHGPVLTAADRGDLLGPVREDRTCITGYLADVGRRRRV